MKSLASIDKSAVIGEELPSQTIRNDQIKETLFSVVYYVVFI